MINPTNKESHRLSTLQDYQIMDTLEERDFDDIAEIASQICGTPISLITLVDDKRQWFKSHHGLATTETPREHAFCAYAIEQAHEVMVVSDPLNDPRFRNNPLVTHDPHIRFYAGAPLLAPNGEALGTLCVIDRKPNALNENQLKALKALANQVMAQMELRKKIRQLEEINKDLNEYAYIVSHDLKSPLNTLLSIVELFKINYLSHFDERGGQMLGMMESRLTHLKNLIDGILHYSLLGRDKGGKNLLDLNIEIPQIVDNISTEEDINIRVQEYLPSLLINKASLEQIFQNLLTNAVKYNDKDKVEIDISCRPKGGAYWEFTVSDNGRGIEEKFIPQIFKPFRTKHTKDRYGNEGTGIGLATVKKLVNRNGGSIEVESEPGKGSKFIFTLRSSEGEGEL
ncbi:ATP-binding protein [Porifericola rhodea]|uniref:sensor histidine kinase n=1 Tax=Porifericola rhodea TaxID=930972 RepID=UPI002666012A|nr:ATP-binding protein [Porifericola rhodea]WKN31527.1 ATP-binding protein [Porifericola rhodea]